MPGRRRARVGPHYLRGVMTILQRLSLFRQRFSPLEERLIATVRDVLPPPAQPIFEAQVAAITLVQRHPLWTEIAFYCRRNGKVDWSSIPMFPRTAEFRLAEVRFTAERRRYKATLSCIAGHIFDFAISPSPKGIAFAQWDPGVSARLLLDPMTAESGRPPEPIPAVWREFIARRPASGGWSFHDSGTAYRTTLDAGEFLVLAELEGDQFVLHRIEPAAATLFYLASHDGAPEPIHGDLDPIFAQTGN